MDHHEIDQSDYGTGQKTLGVYVIGIISCSILTLISFWAVMSSQLTKGEIFAVIYSSAIIQFLVQLICFLRLNTQTEQGRTNVVSIVFTGVILMSVVLGSLWIMWNLNYNMMH